MTIYANTIDYKNAIDSPCCVQFCYLHGKLEEENGFDQFSLSEQEFTELKSVNFATFRDVTVVFEDGRKRKATFYYWHNGEQPRGLVVANDDVAGLQHAEDAYKSRSAFL